MATFPIPSLWVASEETTIFFREPAALIFADGKRMRVHAIWLAIATPTPQNMRHPSLLGQDVLKNWRMTHEPHIARLEFIVKNADLTFNI